MSPYPGVELTDVYHMLESGYRMECPTGCPNKVYAVMQDCWQWEPAMRPTFGEIRERLEGLFNDTNLNEEVERELGSENSNPGEPSYDVDEPQHEMTSNGSSFKVFKSSLNGMPPYHGKQSPGSSPNLNDPRADSQQIAWNSPSSSLISTKSTVVPLKRTSNKSSGNKSNYVQQHKLVNKLKQAPVPPKRTSSFRDSSFQPDLESIRNSINLSNAANRANSNNLSAASKQQLQQPEDEEILEGARETMNGLEKVFESLSGSVQSSTDNLMGSNLAEMKSNSIEDLKNVLNKQKLAGQKLKPSKKGLKLSKSNHKNSTSKKANQSEELEKPNVFSNLAENRNKVQVANLVEPENVKKAINRYGTLPKGASIGYLDSLQTCEINTNDLGDYPEPNDLSGADYPSLMQASDSLLTSPDFVPVDYNRSMKQPINSNNHLATVSRKLSKNKTKKIAKSIDDNCISQQTSPFQLSSPDQRLTSANLKPTGFNLTRQKSDLTHIRTNYENNSFDSINDLDGDLNARRTFLTGSSFFSKSKSSAKKKSTDLPSTSSSASSSNSNTINRDFSLNKDDTSSISSFKPYLAQGNGQAPANLPSPPALFNNARKNLKSPPKQLAAKPFKCSTALDGDKNVFRKPEIPSKFRSQSRNEEEESFYVRSDQLDQLHAQLNSQLSLNSNDPNDQHLEDGHSFGNHQNLSQPAADEQPPSVNTNKSFFESFRLKSRKKSADSQDSPQLPPRNNSQFEEKKKSSVKLPFVGNRKVNKAGPQVPAPKIPLLPRQSVFNSNNQNSLISNSGMAEYVTPVLKKTERRSNDSSDESSNSDNNVISLSKPSDFRKERSLFGLDKEMKDKKNKTGGQIRTRDRGDTKSGRDDEKRQSTCSITSLKQKWEQPLSKHSPESSKSQRTMLNDLNLVNTRDSPLLNEFSNRSRAFINNGKPRKEKNELDSDDLSEQLAQYKQIISQLSNVIERIFDEISINDHDQLKDLLQKIDQLRTNFQVFTDLGFIALHQRFKYNEFLKKFESQASELNQYYDSNVNIKLVTWNKLSFALKSSLKELVSIVENQK